MAARSTGVLAAASSRAHAHAGLPWARNEGSERPPTASRCCILFAAQVDLQAGQRIEHKYVILEEQVRGRV